MVDDLHFGQIEGTSVPVETAHKAALNVVSMGVEKGYTHDEISEVLEAIGVKPYRPNQSGVKRHTDPFHRRSE